MRGIVLLVFVVSCCAITHGQVVTVTGTVYDRENGLPLNGVVVQMDTDSARVITDPSGHFEILTGKAGKVLLKLEKEAYRMHQVQLELKGKNIPVRDIFMTYTGTPWEVSLPLQENELYDEESGWGDRVLLQAGRDIYLNRAAFDFGQVYFRLRGYDAAENEVLLNGFPMNSLLSGRAEWSLWGGLNDVTRNQDISYGLGASEHTPGGMLGSVHIDTAPDGLRMGSRITGSLSNRSYAGRFMLTHVGGNTGDGFSYAFSASRRWAGQGYTEGTSYDAYSLFTSLAYRWANAHRLLISLTRAFNRRGRSAAITPEVFELAGRNYNPYWGWQEGKVRNARQRIIKEPLFQLQYKIEKGKFQLRAGLGYQWGERADSRLGYYNAPNPDPTYYRYLPSYYLNSPASPNLLSAAQAAKAFSASPQFLWESLYKANQNPLLNGRAAYLLSADRVHTRLASAYIRGDVGLQNFRFSWGIPIQNLQARHSARLLDLMGSDHHLDIDPFSETRNDLEGEVRKTEGDTFGYDYSFLVKRYRPYLQLEYRKPGMSAFIAGYYELTQMQREGHFINERYPDNSAGIGKKLHFPATGVKAGIRYGINGRHWLDLNAAGFQKAPLPRNTYINPRDNHLVVPGAAVEKNKGVEINYHLRSPSWMGRLTAYYTRFRNRSDVNFFYSDTGLGSDFIQEVITGIDYLHKGIELGLEHEIVADVTLSVVGALGDFRYCRDPEVYLFFDTSGKQEELINTDGSAYLGYAGLQDYHRASGPQSAFSLGLHYRDPDFWWVAVNANYLAGAYPSVTTLARTPQFLLDPDTGLPHPGANNALAAGMLKQEPVPDIYLLNLTGGRSWRFKQYYLSFFMSLSNLFDRVYATGGYEQGRNANYGQWLKDHIGGNPSFGTKFWYGRGRNFFINLAISF